MLLDLGEKMRELRLQKGYGLNEFAKILSISPSYLSQLETGKTENISFSLLQRLQEELALLPLNLDENSRMRRLFQQMDLLKEVDEESYEFVLFSLESNIKWFIEKKIR
ncbi:helix-turn-helix domain-containing protein [Gottfriedia acidiceleris]|uniref:helix-turn-helix domain-containing protein n=1 Tax=Bacillaceae TaxID=186817 RepID=UPI000BED24D7|nr:MULTISPECIES: helix-turn-helix domain-containing protein [unclassified Bacillus (in: firmicutes)]PEC50248.1 transcriptional regulator [Bacillus sp. AFS096315]PFM77793.1 transcriptional regulator [Bacillus sp. AFS077874]